MVWSAAACWSASCWVVWGEGESGVECDRPGGGCGVAGGSVTWRHAQRKVGELDVPGALKAAESGSSTRWRGSWPDSLRD
jgi:hypothetical protein